MEDPYELAKFVLLSIIKAIYGVIGDSLFHLMDHAKSWNLSNDSSSCTLALIAFPAPGILSAKLKDPADVKPHGKRMENHGKKTYQQRPGINGLVGVQLGSWGLGSVGAFKRHVSRRWTKNAQQMGRWTLANISTARLLWSLLTASDTGWPHHQLSVQATMPKSRISCRMDLHKETSSWELAFEGSATIWPWQTTICNLRMNCWLHLRMWLDRSYERSTFPWDVTTFLL